MSGIYIKGMKMPTNCRECDFMNWGAVEPNRCGITDCLIAGDYDKRHDNCPLIPAADVSPVARGRWVMKDKSIFACSCCGNCVTFISTPQKKWQFGHYCPNCGARMEES